MIIASPREHRSTIFVPAFASRTNVDKVSATGCIALRSVCLRQTDTTACAGHKGALM